MCKYFLLFIFILTHFSCKSEDIKLDTISVNNIEINGMKIGTEIDFCIEELGNLLKITEEDKECIENCEPITRNYWFSETSYISEAIELGPNQLCAFRIWKDTSFKILINNLEILVGDSLDSIEDEIKVLFPNSYELSNLDAKRYFDKYKKQKKYFTISILLKDQADIFESIKKDEESHPIINSVTLRFEDNILNYISIDYYIE